jgi:hypothetical protein
VLFAPLRRSEYSLTKKTDIGRLVAPMQLPKGLARSAGARRLAIAGTEIALSPASAAVTNQARRWSSSITRGTVAKGAAHRNRTTSARSRAARSGGHLTKWGDDPVPISNVSPPATFAQTVPEGSAAGKQYYRARCGDLILRWSGEDTQASRDLAVDRLVVMRLMFGSSPAGAEGTVCLRGVRSVAALDLSAAQFRHASSRKGSRQSTPRAPPQALLHTRPGTG